MSQLPVKAVITLPGSKPILILEVKEPRFKKPPVALFIPPADFTAQVQREWSTTIISSHFELNVEAHGSGLLEWNTGKVTGRRDRENLPTSRTTNSISKEPS